MLAELFDKLKKAAAAEADGRIVKPAAEPDDVYGVRLNDGTIEWHIAEKPLNAKALSTLGVVRALAAFIDVDDEADQPAIWYSRHGVVAVAKRGTRRNRVTLPLDYSDPLQAIIGFGKQRCPLSQSQLVLMLRTTFRECLDQMAGFLDLVRKVRWQAMKEASGVVEHGKTSLGRSITSQLAGVDTMPEFVTFNVPVFTCTELSARFPIECAVDVDAESEKFTLLPVPGHIERAIALAEAKTADTLADHLSSEGVDGVPLLYGTPER